MQEVILNYKKEIQSILDQKSELSETDSIQLESLEKHQTQLLEELQKTLYQVNKNTLTNEIDINTELSSDIDLVEKEYSKYDCKEIPGYIFFHDKIIKSYGLCPYINITGISDENINTSISKELKEKRQNWLECTSDKGKLYYEMYDILINTKEYQHCLQQKEDLENEIENIINITLNNNQKNMYNDALLILKEYNSSKLKSKTLKEKYKKIIYYFSKLFNETHIHIHDYISLKFDTQIIINYSDDNLNGNLNGYLTNNFKEYLDKYILIKNDLINSLKYIKNTNKHLHKSLTIFLKKKEPENYIQEGKYYKKWSTLTFNEQCERLESFSKYYISKRKNFKDKKEDSINKLSCYLKDSLKDKILKYNLMKWNIKLGIIESILFVYDEETDQFKLKIKESTTVKKSPQQATLFTKENDQYINECILNFLIKNKKEPDVLDTEYQDLCFEKIKCDLELKKISKSDRIILKQKYDGIYEIILKN